MGEEVEVRAAYDIRQGDRCHSRFNGLGQGSDSGLVGGSDTGLGGGQ